MNTPTVTIVKSISFSTEEWHNPSLVQIVLSMEELHRIASVMSLVKENDLFSAQIEVGTYTLYQEGEQEGQLGEESDWKDGGAKWIIYEGAFYFYAQNSYDSRWQVESESLTFEEVFALFEPSDRYEPTEEQTYVLFGEQACKILQEDGAE
jgi:hypothetical protein